MISVFGPSPWNNLPTELRDITDTEMFKKRHKTVLFDDAH